MTRARWKDCVFLPMDSLILNKCCIKSSFFFTSLLNQREKKIGRHDNSVCRAWIFNWVSLQWRHTTLGISAACSSCATIVKLRAGKVMQVKYIHQGGNLVLQDHKAAVYSLTFMIGRRAQDARDAQHRIIKVSGLSRIVQKLPMEHVHYGYILLPNVIWCWHFET